MTVSYSDFAKQLVVLVVMPLWLLGFAFWYRQYVRIRFARAFFLALAASAIGVAWAYASGGAVAVESPLLAPFSHAVSDDGRIITYGATAAARFNAGLCFMLMVMFSCGLLARLYAAWVMDSATEQERLPNAKGVRAWLRPMDLVTVAGIVEVAYVGMGWSVWGALAGVLALLLAYPLMNVALKGGEAEQANVEEELAQERARVLALVEAGKISGEDGAELIGALGQSRTPASEERGHVSGNVRQMLLGAVLVVVGFCLPWFTYNLGREVRSAMEEMKSAIGQSIPGVQGVIPEGLMAVPLETQKWLMVRGGEIGKGLGWIILAMGLGAAALPLLWPAKARNRQLHRGITLAGLGVGTVLVIYLTAGYLAAAGAEQMRIGLFLVMAGYVVLWIGALREYVGWGPKGRIAVAA